MKRKRRRNKMERKKKGICGVDKMSKYKMKSVKRRIKRGIREKKVMREVEKW